MEGDSEEKSPSGEPSNCDYIRNSDQVVKSPSKRRSIGRYFYLQFHRSISKKNDRNTVDVLKEKYEPPEDECNKNHSPTVLENKQIEDIKLKPTEISGGSGNKELTETVHLDNREKTTPDEDLRKSLQEKVVKELKIVLTPTDTNQQEFLKETIQEKPIPKPRLSLTRSVDKLDTYSFTGSKDSFIFIKTDSEESIDKIARELSFFTMERKNKKSGLKRIFAGSFFKKDRPEEIGNKNNCPVINNDNVQNETNSFTRNSFSRHTWDSNHKKNKNSESSQKAGYKKQLSVESEPEISPIIMEEIERRYARIHMENFHKTRQDFVDIAERKNEVKSKDPPPKTSITAFLDLPLQVDKSQQMSDLGKPEPERRPENSRNEVKKNQAVKKLENLRAKYSTPPPVFVYENFPTSHQISKDHSDSVKVTNFDPSQEQDLKVNKNINYSQEQRPYVNDLYSTVFDSIEKQVKGNSQLQRPLKTSSNPDNKAELPPPKPKIGLNQVDTDKIIATELLKNSRRSLSPVRNSRNEKSSLREKPPLSPRIYYDNSSMSRESPRPTYSGRNEPLSSSSPVNRIRTGTRSPSPGPRREEVFVREELSVVATPLNNTSSASTNSYPSNVVRSPSHSSLYSSKQSDNASPLVNSPKKEEIRKSVEAYYWKEIKKLKEQKDHEILQMQLYMPQITRQSRSMTPVTVLTRGGARRSVSLPREMPVVRDQEYRRIVSPDVIYERRPVPPSQYLRRNVIYEELPRPQYYQQQGSFIRNAPTRSTFSSSDAAAFSKYEPIYGENKNRPIFKRGSLTKPMMEEKLYQENKKVSFSNPQRLLNNPHYDDEVFYNQTNDTMFRYPDPVRYVDNNAMNYQNVIPSNYYNVYDNHTNNLEMYDPQYQRIRNNSIDNQIIDDMRYPKVNRNNSTSSVRNQAISYNNQYPVSSRVKRMSLVDTPNIYQTNVHANDQLYYSDYESSPNYLRQEESPYGKIGMKQVSVRNKICDIYGQIHDTDSTKTYGQLQNGMIVGELTSSNQDNLTPRSPSLKNQYFRRGTRLTASASDMQKQLNHDYNQRLTYEPRFTVKVNDSYKMNSSSVGTSSSNAISSNLSSNSSKIPVRQGSSKGNNVEPNPAVPVRIESLNSNEKNTGFESIKLSSAVAKEASKSKSDEKSKKKGLFGFRRK